MSAAKRSGLWAVAWVLVLGTVPLAAFSNVEVGETVPNRELAALGGGSQPYLGDARVNVFVFLRPGQEHSHRAAAGIAELADDMADRSVHWTAIVSGSYPEDAIRALVGEAGLGMPVLIDEGDALYGELGASLHPVVGIADGEHKLVAYQHFTKINFLGTLSARVRHQLGEIGDAELAAVLNPQRKAIGGEDDTARRNVNLGRLLLKMGKAEKALQAAQRSLEIDPQLAEGHALLGSALASLGDCTGALEVFDKALELDPEEPTALAGKAACRNGS